MTALTTAFVANLLIYSVQIVAFAYLYVKRRERAVAMWLLGSVLLLTFVGAGLLAQAVRAELMFILLLLAAASCITDGTLRFVGRPLPRAAWFVTLAVGAWAAVASLAGLPMEAASIPAGLWLPTMVTAGGVLLLRSQHGRRLGARVAGIAMLLWGLHFADYPLLRDVEWFAPVGFLIAGTLDMAVALGLFVLHFEVARDHTLQLEARLAEARKLEALGRVTGGIAHDFNNLLTVILSGTQLLSRSPNLSDRDRALLADTAEASERAAALTGQLLAFSRRHPQSTKVIDVVKSLGDMTGLMRAIVGTDAQLRIVKPAGPLPVEIDPGQLNQVLSNLIINARDAIEGSGEIALQLRRTAHDVVELTLSDQGCGMPPEVVDKALEPFFTTKAESKGTGLGLSIVHGIITRAGGTVRLDSAPGRGTTVHIALPLADESRLEREPQLDVPQGAGTVLVAEDEPLLRKAAVEILERGGYAVLEAADGNAALRVFEARGAEIDALVTDIVMPGMDGLELARTVSSERPDLPVIVTSGFPDRIATSSEPIDPRHHFLAKPYTPDALVAAVARALQRARRTSAS